MGIYGVGWALALEAGVRVYGAEIVTTITILLFSPVILSQPISPYLKRVLVAYAVAIFAIAISDLAVGTPIFDSLRAMSTPLIGAISLLFVVTAVRQNLNSFITFLATTSAAKFLFGEPLYEAALPPWKLSWAMFYANPDFFKLSVVPVLTPFIAIIAWRISKVSFFWSASFLLASAAAYLALDARASGGSLLLAGIFLGAIHFGVRPSRSHLLAGACAIMAVAYVSYAAYISYTLAFNPNGHNARDLTRMENPYNPIELVRQGRPEWNIAKRVVAEKPVFGHGSWARDVNGLYTSRMLQAIGVKDRASTRYDPDRYIPVHSLLLSSWIWSGLLGLASSLYLLIAVVGLAISTSKRWSPFLPIALILAGDAIWSIVFSPPQAVRYLLPHALGLMVVLIECIPESAERKTARSLAGIQNSLYSSSA